MKLRVKKQKPENGDTCDPNDDSCKRKVASLEEVFSENGGAKHAIMAELSDEDIGILFKRADSNDIRRLSHGHREPTS